MMGRNDKIDRSQIEMIRKLQIKRHFIKILHIGYEFHVFLWRDAPVVIEMREVHFF